MEKYNHKTKGENAVSVTAIDINQTPIDAPKFASGDLGKIQEILFGQQVRANTDQFSKLNSNIEKRLAGLTDTCQQQFTELKTIIDSRIDSLSEIQTERDKEYQAKLTAITHNHASFETTVTEKFRASSDSSAQVQHQLNKQIENSSAVLSESLNSTRDELTIMLTTAIAELQAQKIDRTALSNLLGTVAAQLTDGHQPSDGTSGDNQQQPQQLRTGSVDDK